MVPYAGNAVERGGFDVTGACEAWRCSWHVRLQSRHLRRVCDATRNLRRAYHRPLGRFGQLSLPRSDAVVTMFRSIVSTIWVFDQVER